MDIKVILDLTAFNEEASKVLGVQKETILDAFTVAMGEQYQLDEESIPETGYLMATIPDCDGYDVAAKFTAFAKLTLKLNEQIAQKTPESSDIKKGMFHSIMTVPEINEKQYTVGLRYKNI